MNEMEKSPRKGLGSSVADWKKVSLITPSSPVKGSLQFGLGSGELVGVLKITIYDVKIQRKGSSGRDKRKDRVDSVYNQELSSSADNPLSFNYACRVKLGKRRVAPRKMLIPLANKPTFLGSYLNFPVQTIDSQLEIEILDLDTQYNFGTLRIPLKDVPFVHESIPFGPSTYYRWRPKRNSNIKGSVRVGLKLSKHKTAVRRVGEWRGKTAGGCLDNPTWMNNPQYFLSVSLLTVLSFKLRSPLGKENYLGFYIIKVAEINELIVKRKAREEDIIKAGEHQQWMAKGNEDILKDIYIQAGSYIIIPCTKYPNVEGSFELTIMGDYDAGIKLDSFDQDAPSTVKEKEGASDSDWGSSEDEDASSETNKTSSESDSRDTTESKKKSEENAQKKRQANLMRAASIGNVNKLKITIEKGGNATFKDKAGASALTLAARNGHIDCVKLLLSKGADANSMDSDGYNAVLMAASGGHANTLKVLLEGGGDLKARDSKGNTALFLGAAFGSLECVNDLIERGASVNDTNNARQTPLMKAAEAGHAPIVKELVKKGAKVNVKDTSGQSPLHFAASSGSLECVTFLIQQGADVMEKDRNGETALHKAALRGHVDILRLFIEKTDKSTNGLTQAMTSKRARNRHWDTISLLMSKEKERGKKNGLLQQLRAGVPATSSTKKKILDVLVILNKHGERHSAYQLISVDGTALSSNLILEEIPSAKEKSEKKKKSKRDLKLKKKELKKKTKSKDGDDEGVEEEDGLVRVVAAGQLSVLCLLIERGRIPNSISTTSSLVYDIIPQSEFERLFMTCVDALSNDDAGDEEKEGALKGSGGEEKLKKGDENGDGDVYAENVKQIHLAMLNAPMGAFMTVLDSIERVNLTIVNCTETQTPTVTDIRKTTELSTFALTGTLNMVGMVVNTRYLSCIAAAPKAKTATPSPRASIDDNNYELLKKNKLLVWVKEGKNLTPPSSDSSSGNNSSGGGGSAPGSAKEKRALDVYCEIRCGAAKYKTSIKKKDANPKWFERFSFELLEEDVGAAEQLEVYVYDKDKGDCLGKVVVPIGTVRLKPQSKWFKLVPRKAGEKASPGELSLELHTAFVNK